MGADRDVLGSNPIDAALELGQFRLPNFASTSRKRQYHAFVPSIWCLRRGSLPRMGGGVNV